MLLLLIHIVGNAAWALLVKAARTRGFDYPLVGFANYATAAVVALAALAMAGLPSFDMRAALFGLVNGIQYLTTYLLMYVLIGLAGIAVTTSFLRLSVAVPVLASIFLWREWPTPIQGIGLLVAGGALPLLSGSARRRSPDAEIPEEPAAVAIAVPVEPVPLPDVHVSLRPPVSRSRANVAFLVGATILISGCGLLAAKAFAELGRPEQRPVYVAAAYVAAALCSASTWPWRERFRAGADAHAVTAGASAHGHTARASKVSPIGRNRPRTEPRAIRSILFGAAIGLVNVGQLWVLLPALAQVPGVIAFPLAAAGGLSLAVIGGWLFWREPVGGRTGAGILLAVLAAALANAP